MIRTKVVATVGPACDSEATLGEMIEAGVNVFRLNFSHGTHETHAAALQRIRQVAAERRVVVAVLGDLGGPKIRLGLIAGGHCRLENGQQVVIQREAIAGTPKRLSSNYPPLIDDVKIGHRLLIDDGNILLRAVDKQPDGLVTVCEVGGVVSDHKGINLPDSTVSAPSLTAKDRADLEWIVEHDLDYVALSFVRRGEDLRQLRTVIRQCRHDSPIQVVSKIEKPEAVSQIDEIVRQSDVVLVARGDLGVEMDVSRVPIIQKEICVHARRLGKPVIIATQMLQSMVQSPVPTRAEVSDVANAILDDADAVMLSAETSVGQYPVQAVQMMRRIASETESFGRQFGIRSPHLHMHRLPVAGAVIAGASVVAEQLETQLVIAWTLNGDAARLLSRHRIDPPIVAITPSEKTCRQMAMLYGVIPVCLPQATEANQALRDLDHVLIDRGLATTDDQVLVVTDMRPDVAGETDGLFVHVVGGQTPC